MDNHKGADRMTKYEYQVTASRVIDTESGSSGLPTFTLPKCLGIVDLRDAAKVASKILEGKGLVIGQVMDCDYNIVDFQA